MSLEPRLSVIAEDGDAQPAPPIPPKASHRPFSKRFNHGDPPRHSYEKSPPPYSIWSVTGPKGERLADLRRTERGRKRGGWRRLCLVALLVVAALVGLIVGLVIGLRNKHSNAYVSSVALVLHPFIPEVKALMSRVVLRLHLRLLRLERSRKGRSRSAHMR